MSSRSRVPNDEGYLLLGLVVICFLMLLALSVAAPRVAKELERDRELESEHRAQQYVRAIQLYYLKTNTFPSSVDQLLGAGASGISSAVSVKYLRQKYKDPLTHDEYRLILVGEAKTQVKGFFGEPLQGAPAGNLGSVAGMQSNFGGTTAPGASGSAPGAPGGSSAGFSLGGSSTGGSSAAAPTTSFGSATPSASGTGAAGAAGAAAGGTGTTATPTTGTGSSTASSGSTSATSFQGSKGAFVGVGSNAKGHGLVEWNGSENIEDWEFLYDPRVELLKAKVSLLGGGAAVGGAGGLGSTPVAAPTSIFAPAAGTVTPGTTNNSTGNSPSGTSPAGSVVRP